jgi:hypothetical protein
VVEKGFALTNLGSNFGQPDGGFHRFDLTEERPQTAEFMVPTMFQQLRRRRSDLPQVRVRLGTPHLDMTANLVDPILGVFLFGLRALFLRIQLETLLKFCCLFQLGNRRDEVRFSPRLDDVLRGLTALVEFPVTRGLCVGRVQNRLREKAFDLGVAHRFTALVDRTFGALVHSFWKKISLEKEKSHMNGTRIARLYSYVQ